MPPGGSINIVILYDGKPVSAGNVDLSGGGGGATLNEKGEAVFSYVPFGTYRVVVFPPIEIEKVIPTEGTAMPAPTRTPDKHPMIPKHFRDEAKTPLQITVDPEQTNRFQFDLKKL